MRVNTIIPLLKNGHLDPRKKTNYRAISLSSVLGKVLDHLILLRYQSQLCSSDYQFAFKAGASCNLVVRFTPAAAGPRAATLTFKSNGGAPTISLNGAGVAPSRLASFGNSGRSIRPKPETQRLTISIFCWPA